jgi:uncharacterized protein (DUF2062 family)
VYYGAWKLGGWVLGTSADDANRPALLSVATPPPSAQAAQTAALAPDPRPWWQRWGQTLSEVGRPLLVGTVIFSVGFSLLAYLLVNGVWRWRVRAKRRRRLRFGR